MELHKNGVPVYEFTPSYGGKKIIISIDSSKSNSAMVVWDEYGHPLDDYEISGAGREVDVYTLCWDMRKELDKLLYGSDVILVGIEDIITKKEDGYHGLDHHMSRAKITAVFDNFIFYFQDRFNYDPIRIPNQSWKADILPEEYRKRTHKKGSKDWLTDIGSRWADRKDDVTDAVCIGYYLIKHNKVESAYEIDATKPADYEYDYIIYPQGYARPASSKLFIIKNNDTLEHNLNTIANRIEYGQIGCVVVPLDKIPIEVIYSGKLRSTNDCKYERHETELLFMVARFK